MSSLMIKKQKQSMLKGRIKYSTKVWYSDPRCFNDSAVDVKRICLYRKARYKIEKKNSYYFQNLFQPKIPIAHSHASEASGSVQLELRKYYWRNQLSVCLSLTLCMSFLLLCSTPNTYIYSIPTTLSIDTSKNYRQQIQQFYMYSKSDYWVLQNLQVFAHLLYNMK